MSAPHNDSVPTIELNDGRMIPQLGFGVFQVDPERVVAPVARALEVGYRHIDTAQTYRNEAGVGRAIAASGLDRTDLWVTTKLDKTRHSDARAALEESLEKLAMDYVDLYLIHWPLGDPAGRLRAWKAMEQAQADGLTTSIGVSNFSPDQLRELLDESSTVPVLNQVEVHPTFTNERVVAFDADANIATGAWSPLGQGADLTHPAIDAIAARLGRTPAQVIIRWHLSEGRVAIPKSITPVRIAENFDVFDFDLTAEDLRTIDCLNAFNRVGNDPAIHGI